MKLSCSSVLKVSTFVALAACSGGNSTSSYTPASGTWLVTDPVTAKSLLTITVSSSGFSVSTPKGERTSITLNGNSATFESRERKGEVVTGQGTRPAAASANYGSLPFSLVGAWNFVNPNKASDTPVVANMGADAWSIGEVGASSRRTWSTLRQSSSASIFGDLGGVWSVKQSDTDCTVTLAGDNVKILCAEGGKSLEEFNMTFDVAAGKASGRARNEELIARRQ